MGKVMTNTGAIEVIKAEPKPAVKSELAPQVKPADPPEAREAPKEQPKEAAKEPEVKADVKESDEGLEAEDFDLSEIVRKKIGKKHRAMKEAQEAAADAESFAKNQYDRARLAEERAAQLERELSEVKRVQAPKAPELKQPEKGDAKYQVDGQFDWDAYTNDVAEFKAKKAVQELEAKRIEEAQKAAQEKDAAERAEAAKKFREKADKIEGFQEKLAGSEVWFPNAVLEYITESDDGPEIVMHLLSNPETATSISKLRPIKAIAEIGKLQKTLGAKAEKAAPVQERGGAPPPITPISGSGTGTVNTDPSKMSFRELREYERARRKKH